MFSQTADYALRAMVCLAGEPDRLTPTPELARQTGVPSNYLAKVLQMLASSDLIIGRRGVGGGYKLSKPAEEVSLLDVINAVSPLSRSAGGGSDGSKAAASPIGVGAPRAEAGTNNGEAHPGLVMLHQRMNEATEAVMDVFEKTTLADMADESTNGRGSGSAERASSPAAPRAI